MNPRAKRPMIRAVLPSDPIRLQPTWFMCRLAAIQASRSQMAAARFALKERRLDLVRQIAEIDEADAQLQKNLFWDFRRIGRFRAHRLARPK